MAGSQLAVLGAAPAAMLRFPCSFNKDSQSTVLSGDTGRGRRGVLPGSRVTLTVAPVQLGTDSAQPLPLESRAPSVGHSRDGSASGPEQG